MTRISGFAAAAVAVAAFPTAHAAPATIGAAAPATVSAAAPATINTALHATPWG